MSKKASSGYGIGWKITDRDEEEFKRHSDLAESNDAKAIIGAIRQLALIVYENTSHYDPDSKITDNGPSYLAQILRHLEDRADRDLDGRQDD